MFEQTQIVTNPDLIPFPFSFKRYIPKQGTEITVKFPDQEADRETLLQQAQQTNPEQLSLIDQEKETQA